MIDGAPVLSRELGDQETYVRVQLLQVRVLEGNDLGHEGIEVPEGDEGLAELLPCLLVELFEPPDGRIYAGVHARMIGGSLLFPRRVEDLAELLHLVLVVDLLGVELRLQLIELLCLRLFPDGGLLVVRLKGIEDLFRLVHEVEDKGILLAGMGPVEPREGLYRLDAGEPLVHVHRVEERLVESRLVFLGNDEDLVLFAPEALRKLLLADTAVHAHFRVGDVLHVRVDHGPGEGNESLYSCVLLLRNVLVEGLLVPHRMEAAGGDDHCLGPPPYLVHRKVPEVLYHDLRLLGDIVLMEAHEPGKGPGGLALLHLRVVLDGLYQPVVRLVRGVVLEHVEDEVLLDGLPHAVKVKGLGLAVRTGNTEDLHRPVLRGRGEGEEADVRLLPPLGHGLEDLLLVVG